MDISRERCCTWVCSMINWDYKYIFSQEYLTSMLWITNILDWAKDSGHRKSFDELGTVNLYSWSHPENDPDVTQRAKLYTLHDASFICVDPGIIFWTCEKTHVTWTIISIFLWNTCWRHDHSRGETKYRHLILYLLNYIIDKNMFNIWRPFPCAHIFNNTLYGIVAKCSNSIPCLNVVLRVFLSEKWWNVWFMN